MKGEEPMAKRKLRKRKLDDKAETSTKNRKLNLKPLQSTQKNLPFQSIYNGIVITKNNEYIKIMEIQASKFSSMTLEQKMLLADQFSKILGLIPATFQFTSMTFPADVSEKIKELNASVEKETNDKCRRIDYEYRLKLLESAKDSYSKRYFLSFKFIPSQQETRDAQEIYVLLNQTANEIKNALSSIDNEAIILTDLDEKNYLTQSGGEATNQTSEILYSILNRDAPGKDNFRERFYQVSSRYAEKFHTNAMYVPIADVLAPDFIAYNDSHYVVVNGTYYSFLYIPENGYNQWVYPGWLDNIVGSIPGVDINVYAHREDSNKMSQKIRFNTTYANANASFSSSLSEAYSSNANAINAGIYFQNALNDNEDFYYVATTVTVSGASPREVEDKIRIIQKSARINKMHSFVPCLYENEELFESSLPLATLPPKIFNRIKHNVASSGLSSFYLFTNYTFNEKDGVYYGINQTDGSLVIINSFDRNLRGGNGNMFIFGITGSGKSYAMFLLAIRHRIKQIPIWMIIPEKEKEAVRLCDQIGGTFVQIASQSKDIINVMDIHVKDKSKIAFTDGAHDDVPALSEKVEFLRAFFSIVFKDMDEDKFDLLEDAIITTYAKKGITSNDNSIYADKEHKKLKEMPILADLQATLIEKCKKLEEEARATNSKLKYDLADKCEKLARGFRRYVSGNFKSLNGQTNVNLNTGFVVFGLEHLNKDDLPMGLFMVMDYVWSRVKENRFEKSMIFVDEFWRMITNNFTADYFVNIARTVRGYNSSLTVATQSIQDVMSVGGVDTSFVSNMLAFFSTRFVMKQMANDIPLIEKELNLDPALAEELPTFPRGTTYMMSGNTVTKMRFEASETEDYLINTDGEKLKEIEDAHQRNLLEMKQMKQLQEEKKKQQEKLEKAKMALENKERNDNSELTENIPLPEANEAIEDLDININNETGNEPETIEDIFDTKKSLETTEKQKENKNNEEEIEQIFK